MQNEKIGSTWKKWDLHVHTPASIIHHYPGGEDAAWEAFLSDLEELPAEFKVIGINDYVFVDGYERVLRAKREQGRLKNLDLILPVVELRLDKFGGVVQKTKDGYSESNWSRINLHVIFDEIDPALIRDQFLSAITRHYKLMPEARDHEARWGGVITRENLRALGEAIIAAAPDDQKSGYDDPLTAGKWRAHRPVHLQTGRNCLWHVPSGPLPLMPATYGDCLGVIDDPWAGWTEQRQGADPKQPFFGPGHPGIIWLNVHERSQAQPDAIAISSIEWSGARHSNGANAEPTRRFWASLLRWMNRHATKLPRSGRLDGGTAEIYALSDALAEIQAGTPRSANPAPFEHVT